MKKIISLSLALILSIGILSACGREKNAVSEDSKQPTSSSATSQPSEKNTNDFPDISENKEVVKDSDAPKIFMIENPESETDSLTYHLENCELLNDQKTKEVTWEYVKTIGFWQCPKCNPPRYEDYRNAQ